MPRERAPLTDRELAVLLSEPWRASEADVAALVREVLASRVTPALSPAHGRRH